MTKIDPLATTQALIRCPSVTPEEGGALDYLQQELEKLGFACTRLPFSDESTPDVDNLFARIGDKAPHFCFAGHTDVVPTGDHTLWTHPPFNAALDDGYVWGRGAVDMKGGVACFVAAVADYLSAHDGDVPGSISLLITGDEEGPSINGTPKMLKWAQENGQIPDHCIVGEPTNSEVIGDVIKIGRRGSLNGVISVNGAQGHSAYLDKARNPVPELARIVAEISSAPLDDGNEHFQPTTLAVTSFDVGNPAVNVVPAAARAMFNVRFNTEQTPETIEAFVRAACDAHASDYTLEISVSGDAFITNPGPFVETVSGAIANCTGHTPALTTGGGTSDARYIKNYCQVIEFGLVNKTIHAVDERAPISDIEMLAQAYRDILGAYFAQMQS
ncbi:MAG: succinyl-diaminopimelate desuccinylase [Hyphomicrobiales bacterium]